MSAVHDEISVFAEDNAVATMFAIACVGPITVTQAYKDQAVKISMQRVYQAGMRLANILNSELK